ncbi:MAG: histidine--tRNA ligase [Clostridia bacterium]|nr:histidine--tRNA ligase [Clostridia bacterium]
MINIPKGTKDMLPQESYKWHYLENNIKEITRLFDYKEIRTPVFEHTELFLRGVGETTDIVGKEMYTFMDKGNRSITLKPEGTAGVARSFVENGLHQLPQPLKCYYFTPVFRYERPQAGRLREHHQFGVEVFGVDTPAIDAEVISTAKMLFERLNINNLTLYINSIGCKECRANYNEALRAFFKDNIDRMCPTCRERLVTNPLRILDCKVDDCIEINKNAPSILEYLCDSCREHHEGVQNALSNLGILYKIDPRIVRGLDYYTKTVFEFVSENIGAKGTVCGGGRYNGLVEQVGGKSCPAVGFGMGLERLLLTLEAESLEIVNNEIPTVYIGDIEQKAYVMRLVAALRRAGISALCDLAARSVKAQLKYADKLGALYTIVIGDEELKNSIVKVRNMKDGSCEEVAIDEIIAYFKNKSN